MSRRPPARCLRAARGIRSLRPRNHGLTQWDGLLLLLVVLLPPDRDAANVALSVSVQLSSPAAYTGARLEFAGERGPCNATSLQGAAIFFRPSTLHRVAPVAARTRLALVAWFRVRDELFWGRSSLLSADPCLRVFPLLAPGIPASFRDMPWPAEPDVLISAARLINFAQAEVQDGEGTASAQLQQVNSSTYFVDLIEPVWSNSDRARSACPQGDFVDTACDFVDIDNSNSLGPPRRICVVSPWPSGVAVCATQQQSQQGDYMYGPRAGRVQLQHGTGSPHLELLAFAHRYRLRPCS